MGSLTSKHVNNLGFDHLYLAHLRRTLHHQLKTIEDEIKRYYNTVLEDDREDKNKPLQSRLRSIKQYYTEKLDRFEHTVNSISQMVSNGATPCLNGMIYKTLRSTLVDLFTRPPS